MQGLNRLRAKIGTGVKLGVVSILKILLVLFVLIAGYYLLILAPRVSKIENLSKAEQIISSHRSTLVQNRLAYVELTKLDSASPAFDIEKSNLIANIQKNNQKGLSELENLTEIPDINRDLSRRYSTLLQETINIYQDQEKLLEKVFATSSYADGVEILRSDKSIKLITRQTNLILEFEWWLAQLRK